MTWEDIRDLSAEELRLHVELWLWGVTTLNTAHERTAFDFIVVAAAQLEFEAVALLWADKNEPLPWPDFETRTTLKMAAKALGERGLFSGDESIAILEAVADLRNDVVHRRAAQHGVTLARYGANHLDVFGDLDSFKHLVWDFERTRAAVRAERDKRRPVPQD